MKSGFFQTSNLLTCFEIGQQRRLWSEVFRVFFGVEVFQQNHVCGVDPDDCTALLAHSAAFEKTTTVFDTGYFPKT